MQTRRGQTETTCKSCLLLLFAELKRLLEFQKQKSKRLDDQFVLIEKNIIFEIQKTNGTQQLKIHIFNYKEAKKFANYLLRRNLKLEEIFKEHEKI